MGRFCGGGGVFGGDSGGVVGAGSGDGGGGPVCGLRCLVIVQLVGEPRMPAKRRDDECLRRTSRTIAARSQAACEKGALVQGGMPRCHVGDKILVLRPSRHDGQGRGAHGGEFRDRRHGVGRVAVGVADGEVPWERECVMPASVVEMFMAVMRFVVVVMGVLLAHCVTSPRRIRV